jgi:hypothetical protein
MRIKVVEAENILRSDLGVFEARVERLVKVPLKRITSSLFSSP